MIVKNRSQNNSGFTIVFLLITLPTLLALLTLIYHLVYLIEFKNEFRFICINESLQLQKQQLSDPGFAQIKSAELLEKLKGINSPVQFNVHLADDPKYEPQNNNTHVSTLVYELNYRWIRNFYLKCGVNKIIKDDEWQYEIIYSTNVDKF